MTRVIAGAARGRRLAVPPRGTRPTSDRAREGLFSTVESLLGTLQGRRVLDLYAGSGAVGLEALSRGAAAVVLVEDDPQAARVIGANVESVGLPGATLAREPVARHLAGRPQHSFDLVFLDPPYATADDEVGAVVRRLVDGWLVDAGVVVLERATRRDPWAWPPGLDAVKERRYGEGTLWYGRAAAETGRRTRADEERAEGRR